MSKSRYIAVDATVPMEDINKRYFTAYSTECGPKAFSWISHSARAAIKLERRDGEKVYPDGVKIYFQEEGKTKLVEHFIR